MKLIKEFGSFIANYKPITLYIKGQSPIILDTEKSKQKELLIRSIINELYDGESFVVNGVTISTELLNKAQKNIAILYEIVDIAKEEGVGIQTADELINFISTHHADLFHPDGLFFDRIYKKLGITTEKGKEKELISDELFKKYATTKGFNLELKSPTSDEDKSGIDSYFELNDKIYNIQTKTLSSITEDDLNYHVYITGYFTEIKTHYLVLISNDRFNRNYIFKGKNVKTPLDKSGVNYYLIPKSDLLYTE